MNRIAVSLLIVPYGIETHYYMAVAEVAELLIVPYGIETREYDRSTHDLSLLIVPYGIETIEPFIYETCAVIF